VINWNSCKEENTLKGGTISNKKGMVDHAFLAIVNLAIAEFESDDGIQPEFFTVVTEVVPT
jgi:hypothetical protein